MLNGDWCLIQHSTFNIPDPPPLLLFRLMNDFRGLIDLAAESLGGSVLYATDDFFAEKENLLRASAPVWKEHQYTDRGKWMDGWESRRKREPGHDFAIIRLGLRGILEGVVVDTSFFRGNYPDSCSIEACSARTDADIASLLAAEWTEILPEVKLAGDGQNLFEIESSLAFTHVRFHIYPDGGVARLRLHGRVVPDWKLLGGLGNELDLAAAENGAEVLSCSDMFFGPKHNLIMPGRSLNMSGGWETKRRRGPGHDWVIVRLATEGELRRLEIDTNHFKGNYPDTASVEGCRVTDPDASPEDAEWHEVLPRTKLQAHTRHFFIDELQSRGPFTHFRLNVFPDGGVSRLRAHGIATRAGIESQVTKRINSLPDPRPELLACCGSTEWAERVASARPFESWNDLTAKADAIWRGLKPEDWLEAFRAHPRIGERKPSHGWAADEQAGATTAGEVTLSELANANREYEKRFGHIFIVCATGKSADEMLSILQSRLGNPSEAELEIAAEEQRKITHLRLRKLVTG